MSALFFLCFFLSSINHWAFFSAPDPFADLSTSKYVYHNSKYATSSEKETRDEHRIYFNSKNDTGGTYYKPDDIILFVKIHNENEQNIIYKVLYLKSSSGEYKKVSSILIETFFNTLNAPLKEFEQRLINEEATLEEKISTFEENEKNKAELSIDLHKNIKKLESIMSNIKGLN